MKNIILMNSNNEFLSRMLQNSQVDHEIFTSIAQFAQIYDSRAVTCNKLIVSDTLFKEEDDNTLSKLDQLYSLVSSVSFKCKTVHFIISQASMKQDLIELIQYAFQEMPENKLEINKFPSLTTAIEIYNVILSKKETKDSIVNTYEQIIKTLKSPDQVGTPDNPLSMTDNSVQFDSPNTKILQTTDYKNLLQYTSISKLLGAQPPNIKTVESTDITKIDISSIENPASDTTIEKRNVKKLLVTGERVSGKYTLALSLALSLFQLDFKINIFDLTDNSSFKNIKDSGVDCNYLDVSSFENSPNLVSMHINSLGQKAINVITGDSELTLEYSLILQNVYGMSNVYPDYEIYIINLSRLELLNLSEFEKIFVTVATDKKYLESTCSLLSTKLKNKIRNCVVKIVPMSLLQFSSNYDMLPKEFFENLFQKTLNDLDYKNRNINIIYTSPLKIESPNLEGQFAIDMLGGIS